MHKAINIVAVSLLFTTLKVFSNYVCTSVESAVFFLFTYQLTVQYDNSFTDAP